MLQRFLSLSPTPPQQGQVMELPEHLVCTKKNLARWFLWVQKAPTVPKKFGVCQAAVVFCSQAAVVFYSLQITAWGMCSGHTSDLMQMREICGQNPCELLNSVQGRAKPPREEKGNSVFFFGGGRGQPLPNLGHLCLICLVQVCTCIWLRASCCLVHAGFEARAWA